MAFPVEIVNGTIRIIQQSDQTTIGLVYATWAIAFATIAGIIVTTWYTRRSLNETRRTNKLMALELKTKFRPKFQLNPANMKYTSMTSNAVKFSCWMINTGTVAVSNIVIHHYESAEEISPYVMLKNWHTIKKTRHAVMSTIEPNNYHDYEYTFIGDPAKDAWIGLWINYEYLDGIKEECLIIIRFSPPQNSRVEFCNRAGYVEHDHNRLQAERDNQ